MGAGLLDHAVTWGRPRSGPSARFAAARRFVVVMPRLLTARGFPTTRAGLRGAVRPCARPRSGPSARLATARHFVHEMFRRYSKSGKHFFPGCGILYSSGSNDIHPPLSSLFEPTPSPAAAFAAAGLGLYPEICHNTVTKCSQIEVEIEAKAF